MKRSQNKSSPDPSRIDLSRKRLGDYGERLAAKWYEAQGFTVLARQWKTAGGELDLVLVDCDTIVFCEVKVRTSDAFGSPLESVTHRKQQRVRTAAFSYLRMEEHPLRPNVRFDVASVRGSKVEIYESAF